LLQGHYVNPVTIFYLVEVYQYFHL